MMDKELLWHEIEELDRRKEPLFDLITVKSRNNDGTEGRFIKVKPPDWVTVIPILPDGKFLMVRQYRHGSASLSDEFPAGVIDPGEEPLDAAKRELLEETGYRARKMDLHWQYQSQSGFHDQQFPHLSGGGPGESFRPES